MWWVSAVGGCCISIHALRGEGDKESKSDKTDTKHFNPRPPWGGRQEDSGHSAISAAISIHALRGEGDVVGIDPAVYLFISIHALRGEGDEVRGIIFGETFISIHALRGEGDTKQTQQQQE